MTGDEIAEIARAWLGTPYRHQASRRGAGCDCLGLLRGVWREAVGPEPEPLPPYRADWRDPENAGALLEAAKRWLVRAEGEMRAGDVVLFRLHRTLPPKHCGIIVSAAAFIHAQEKLGVIEANLTPGWSRRLAGQYRFPKAGTA